MEPQICKIAFVGKKPMQNGILAQLGEHLPYKQRVIGSSPIGSIMARWLSWLEHTVHTRGVVGSSPTLATEDSGVFSGVFLLYTKF